MPSDCTATTWGVDGRDGGFDWTVRGRGRRQPEGVVVRETSEVSHLPVKQAVLVGVERWAAVKEKAVRGPRTTGDAPRIGGAPRSEWRCPGA